MLSETCGGSIDAVGEASPSMDAAPAADRVMLTDQFDLARFTRPPGRRDEDVHALRFTQQRGSSFCRIAIHRSVPSQGSLAADFARAWSQQVLGAAFADVAAPPPACREVVAGDGWTVAAGAAPIALDRARVGVALLLLWGGHGRRQAIVAIYDDDAWRPTVDAFVASVRLTGPPDLLRLPGRTWTRTAGLPGADAAWTYIFDPDGSYTFHCERRPRRSCGGFEEVEEAGRWRMAEAYLLLEPVQSQSYWCEQGAAGGRSRSAPRSLPLEPMAYLYRTRFDAACGEWVLVLAPVGGRPTFRDGPFVAGASAAERAYLFRRARRSPVG